MRAATPCGCCVCFPSFLFVRTAVLAVPVLLEHRGQRGVINISIIITSHNNAVRRGPFCMMEGPRQKTRLSFTFGHIAGWNFNHALFSKPLKLESDVY